MKMRRVKAVSFSHNVLRLEELKNTLIKMGGAANKEQLLEAGFNPKLLGFNNMRITSAEVQQVIDMLPKITFMVTYHKGQSDSVIFRLALSRQSIIEKNPSLKKAFDLVQSQRLYSTMPETHETKMIGWANYTKSNDGYTLLATGTNFQDGVYEKLAKEQNIPMSVFKQLHETMFGYNKPLELIKEAFEQIKKDLGVKTDHQIKQEKVMKSRVQFGVMCDELEKSLKVNPIKWRPLTDDEIHDEVTSENDLQIALGLHGYYNSSKLDNAKQKLKNHSTIQEIDPSQLSNKNDWRFNFDNYKKMKNQVTSYGGPKDPDGMIRSIQSGKELPMPVVVKQLDGSLLLGGGATRTSIAKLSGQKIKALVFDQASSKHGKLQKKKNELKYNADKLGLDDDHLEGIRLALLTSNNGNDVESLKDIKPHIGYKHKDDDYKKVMYQVASIAKEEDDPDMMPLMVVHNMMKNLSKIHEEENSNV